MAGYSGTPLPRKLGIKEGHRVTLINAPDDFESTLGPVPPGVDLRSDLRSKTRRDVIVLFVDRQAELERRFEPLATRLTDAGGLWICWPKKASGVETDLNDGVVRAVGLARRLVDNKVCAIDATWSALRFVYRLRDRAHR